MRKIRRNTVVPAIGVVIASFAAAAGVVGPAHATTAENYVALGDSFSAGQGSQSRYDNKCDRTDKSFPALWAQSHDPASFESVACGGATADNITSTAQDDRGVATPQIDAVTSATSLVTITVGGNDVEFIPTLTTCALAELGSATTKPDCQNAIENSKAIIKGTKPLSDGSTLPQKLADTYRAIASKAARGARILAIGYPELFNVPRVKQLVSDPSRALMNEAAVELNTTIKSAAESAGVRYVDVRDNFVGHGAGPRSGNDAWINDLNILALPNSGHPNAAGYKNGYLPAMENALG
ncbi:SGNH/GDSL hydrolase family protein [Leifsonia sp. ZF2019]|uniref:SGNH/GDSL hydrolase family protein n=1 Tax=Leifsonia sp. ZF2019 TaxID=2781978 RepID=UPI001CC08253|nr:SGNH/GDSL hydrolase family protein [Leifsonia sp. ZF2019]